MFTDMRIFSFLLLLILSNKNFADELPAWVSTSFGGISAEENGYFVNVDVTATILNFGLDYYSIDNYDVLSGHVDFTVLGFINSGLGYGEEGRTYNVSLGAPVFGYKLDATGLRNIWLRAGYQGFRDRRELSGYTIGIEYIFGKELKEGFIKVDEHAQEAEKVNSVICSGTLC